VKLAVAEARNAQLASVDIGALGVAAAGGR
jgi:hypothetical protein